MDKPATKHDPAVRIDDVTPSDSTVLTSRAIWVGSGGDLAVIPGGQSTAVTIKNVPSGCLLPLQVSKVMSTNTTASYIQVWN